MNSIWSDIDIPKRNPLPGDCCCDIAVIGGGMAGILTAFYLQQQGRQVIVLEASRTGSGQTSGTTAKITSQHNLIYRKMIQTAGLEQAKLYADANQQAVRAYQRIIQEQNISCDFQTEPAFLYSVTVSDPLKQEAEAAARLGIPASFVTAIELPFHVHGAVRFDEQAQFHPMKFLQALSMSLTIYERTTVLSVKDHQITTDHGTVTAGSIVFACHYPFVNLPGLYFARMYQQRSYVLALKRTPELHGMYLGIEEKGLSFRQSGDNLLLGGRGHRTGVVPSVNPYKSLQSAARHLFAECKTAAHWSAQDCMSIDGLPYIGHFSPSTPDWYVATGFGKWGMTSSMVSAMLLTDLICQKPNPYTKLFSPQRFHPKAAFKKGSVHIAESVKGLSLGLTRQSLNCPHLGCKLSWNPAESTWECPCHGSRFHYTGQLLSGPAQSDLPL